jgi:hypothetical protein
MVYPSNIIQVSGGIQNISSCLGKDLFDYWQNGISE